MNLYTICLLLFSMSLLGGCSSAKKKSQQNAPENEEMAEVEKPIPPVAPAPGSVHLTAEVLSLEPVDDGFHCQLKIVSVEAYGANAKPLAVGTEITASISKDVIATATAENEEAAAMKSGTTQNLTLRYQQVPSLPGMKPVAWRVLSIR
ncbi:MAG: hypothetical protein AAF564_25480 [Bacteroidota bacterium]